MIILVINCGSSSIKYQLLDMKSEEVYDLLAKGLVEKIGLPQGRLSHTPAGKAKVVKDLPVPDHKTGLNLVLSALVDPEHGVLKSFDDIEAVGHRIVHGAEFFSASVPVDEEVISKIEQCNEFAPLHNPANVLGIRACQAVLPSVPQVAVFDTAFHQTMPPYTYMYGLPYEYYEKYRVRRRGSRDQPPVCGGQGGQALRAGHKQLQDNHLPHRQRQLHHGRAEREVLRHLYGPDPAGGPDNGHPQRRCGRQRHHLSA